MNITLISIVFIAGLFLGASDSPVQETETVAEQASAVYPVAPEPTYPAPVGSFSVSTRVVADPKEDFSQVRAKDRFVNYPELALIS